MKKQICLVIIMILMLGAFVVVGCGEKTATDTGKEKVPGTKPTDKEPTKEPGDETFSDPEKVVQAYCQALIDGRDRESEVYIDEESIGNIWFGNNRLLEVVSLTTTGSGDKRQVVVEIYYSPCEYRDRIKGSNTFTLVGKDGQWKISGIEGDI